MTLSRPLKIGIDAHGSKGLLTGLGRYVQSLLGHWLAQPSPHEFHLFCAAPDAEGFRVPGHERIKWHIGGDWHHSAGKDILWHSTVLPLRAAQLGLDVLFIHVDRRIPLWSPVPVVATVHDLAALDLPGKYAGFSQRYSAQVVPWLIGHTRHLIAVSETTRDGVLSRLHLDPSRIQVIPNGVDAERFAKPEQARIAATKARLKLTRDYLLFPGRIEHPGKNHVGAIAALAKALPRLAEPIDLVCAGKPWQGAEVVQAAIAAHGLGDRVHLTGFISDDDLVDLYHGARALLFPSRVEGFGLPLVEAMAAGIPIITSNASCLPEIAGDAALLAGPDDHDGLADALVRILSDPALAADLVAKGRQRVARYQWSTAARDTLAVIEAAAGG